MTRISTRRAVSILLDLLLVWGAWWLSFWLRFNLDLPAEYTELALQASPFCLLAYAAALLVAGVWRPVWAYIGLPELRQLALGLVLGAALSAAVVLALRLPNFPRSVLVLHPFIAVVLLGAARAGWRTLVERRLTMPGGRRLLIVGHLQEASDALRALKNSPYWAPVGIVSPQAAEVGRSIQGIPVLGTLDAMASACADVQAQTALVASPPGSPARRQALLAAPAAGVTLLTMPRPDEWLKAEGTGPRKVAIEDLLGRDAVQLDIEGLAGMLSGQTVMVTGAGGSIGSELCRQIARLGAARLVCVDLSEYAVYQLEQELRESHPQMRGIYYTANVREPQRLAAIAQRHQPAVVFHAAAYKHVPLMEQLNEIEALRTNVMGTLHAARVAGECGARRFVMISTDKAVNPTNVMGASKRLAELMVQAVAKQYPQTRFVSVRFGNVLGSSGSVVPLFTAQIARGGPVTVTHPDIVRYFMTIPEAAQLVLQAGLMGRSGEIFVLDMGEPVRIVELARMLIRLSGHTEQEIPVTFTGLRPGEKLYEELLADDETTLATPHPKLRVAKAGLALPDVEAVARWIEQAGAAPSEAAVREWLRGQVPEYTPPGAVPVAVPVPAGN
ncbi:nucleoside-diphosphate sugar epimerase/dehydratase [Ramlibacter tataouinensis]|uniref:polysaccharide biosynthesis protein n=1 Tax=Ramlibacter tataouinensis TaxID=94132 RepID=UPI0022F3B19B|nr:nucleoside-diphosphate sugar epimerase/dehydratase [Ramlibacter tataouinensis]WBY00907.1 nucleoside-diphosphate sugar epimerase/dehydratase [Ramlibacter tataouinensis]